MRVWRRSGRTSALIAATLLEASSAKRFWLYDSFEGLPAPSKKDLLLHDIFGLGSIDAYTGQLASPESEVIAELARIGFPPGRAEICKGWIEQTLASGRNPETVAFAYLDMDFYQSTADALQMLVRCMPPGGTIVVDDYGFFSSGVQTAVDEVQLTHPGVFEMVQPFGLKFAVLRRV